MKQLIKNLLHIDLVKENSRLRAEVEKLSRIADAEHRRANFNEKFVPNF